MKSASKPRKQGALTARPRKPLGLELKQGCQDQAVIGGLRDFMTAWARQVQQELGPQAAARAAGLAKEFADYSSLPPERRKEVVERALQNLEASRHEPVSWEDPVTALDEVGPHRAELLLQLGLGTVGDLLCYYPSQYEDRTQVTPLSQAQHRQPLFTQVTVTGPGKAEYRTRPQRAVVPARDETGTCQLVWYNQPYMARHYAPGDILMVKAQARCYPRGLTLMVSRAERIEPGSQDQRGIVPVYATAEGLSPQMLRNLILQALSRCREIPTGLIPPQLAERRGLRPLREAIPLAHQPPDLETAHQAQGRLIYEALFALQARMARQSQRHRQTQTRSRVPVEGVAQQWSQVLPFALTAAQQHAIEEILADLQAEYPGHRLLHGDVGAGKTVVAGAALLAAAQTGRQAVLMAPTELLAEQHYQVLSRLFTPLDITVHLLTGSVAASSALALRAALAQGEALVTVGTHALFQQGVEFADLAVVVVDEQHRFGVRQRSELAAKGTASNLLVMSATPIPRTLALTAYGDFDITVLDELPPGRQPVYTQVLTKRQRRQAYSSLVEHVSQGQRGFVVCPVITQGKADYLVAAERLFARLQQEQPGLRWGLIHGRVAGEERERTMERFRRGELEVLVATSVVEVGVDVPEASLMIVENAERFGLAQLHQLRGRVARAAEPASCYLITVSRNPEVLERLQVLERTTDGFEIAQEDLLRRGPGELLGKRQHGYLNVRLAEAASDTRVLSQVRAEAFALLERDPDLQQREHRALRDYLARTEQQPGDWTL